MHIGHFNGQIPYTRAPHLHTISPPAWRIIPRHGNHTCDAGGECSSRHDFDEYPPVYLKYAWRGVCWGGWLGGLYSPQPPAPTYAPPGVFQANGRKGAKVMVAETCGDSKRACPIPTSSPDRCHNYTPCCQPCKHPRGRQAGQGQMVSAQSTTHPFAHGIPVGLIRHRAPGFPVM